MGCLHSIPSEAYKALAVAQKLLGDSLEAVYLHGSAVAGGLRPQSDVDLLVVVDRAIKPEVVRLLMAELMKISGRYPKDSKGKRPIEMIVFSRADLDAAFYPVRSEFIYGEWLRQDYESGKILES